MPRNNWTPVVLDLLYLLTEEGGATLKAADNGDGFRMLNGSDINQLRKDYAEELTGVDQSALCIQLGVETATLYLVFGNEPSELISDWGAPNASRVYWMLEAITRKFSDQWEGKPCPVIEDEPEPIPAQAYIKAARRLHGREGTLEIDDDPKVSEGCDEGAYVAAWVWVADADVTAEDRA
jgi:hypothetical protein